MVRAIACLLGIMATAAWVSAGEPEKRKFDVPADLADKSLRAFSVQSGSEVLFSSDAASGVRTNAIKGEFLPGEAVKKMLAGTTLYVRHGRDGVFRIAATPRPKAPGAALNPGQNDRPGEAKSGARSRDPPPGPSTNAQPNQLQTSQLQHNEFPPVKNRNLLSFLAGWLAAGAGLDAQTATASSSGALSASADEVVQLTVFEVAADRDDSYGSTTSTSLTGTRKEMRRLPVSAEVMNRALIDDLGVTELPDLLKFAPGTGGSLISGGSSDPSGTKEGDAQAGWGISLRGLGTAQSLNGLFSDVSIGSYDSFDKERVEIIRGPQGLLYGPTSVSGIAVVNTKRPKFERNALRASLRTDSEGSLRGEVEANVASRVPGTKEQKVALLVASFRDHTKWWRVNNEAESRGTFVAGAWRVSPKLTLRAEYEESRRVSTYTTTIRLAAPANDPTYGSRNNLPLRLLLAQGRAADIFAGGLNYANADSFLTDMGAEPRNSKVFSAQAEAAVTPWLSVLVQGGATKMDLTRVGNASTGLTPPNLSGNPTGDWALQLTPIPGPQYRTEKVWRGLVNITPPAWRFMKHELTLGADTRFNTFRSLGKRYMEIDAQGEFIRNPATLNNGFSGRTVMPTIWWAPRTQGFNGPPEFRYPTADIIELSGRRYKRDFVRNQFPQFVTTDNPLGFSNGSTGIQYTDTRNSAGYAALNTDWFDGRVDTLAGYRYDVVSNKNLARPFDDREFREGSYLFGLNWHLSRQFTVYAARSSSFRPGGGGAITPANELVPPSSGVGQEAGLKFNFLEGRISGVVTAFSADGKNNAANLASDVRAVVDYTSSVNGRANGGISYTFDHETKGYEFNLTAAPVRGLRVQAGFMKFSARDSGDAILPIYYNDQFNVNAAGQVTLGNGTPLLVPVAPNTPGWNPANPTVGVPAQALTLQMLRNGDANGNYRAALEPNSGQITNAGALYLNTPTVGTGVTGLPVARHQLGFIPPSGATYVVRKGGDIKTGNSPVSFSTTANYRFPDGRLRGLGFGGNYRLGRDQISYYYTDRSNPAAPVRKPFYVPDQQFVTLFASYEWRFKRGFTLHTQLNVMNALNDVKAIIYPNLGNGTPDNATLSNAPRVWAWTNSVRF